MGFYCIEILLFAALALIAYIATCKTDSVDKHLHNLFRPVWLGSTEMWFVVCGNVFLASDYHYVDVSRRAESNGRGFTLCDKR